VVKRLRRALSLRSRMRGSHGQPEAFTSCRVRHPGYNGHMAQGVSDSDQLAACLANRRVGETLQFPRPVTVATREYTHAVVEKDFRTASRAQLMRFHPGGDSFICKFEDVRQEHGVMCALREMNARWRQCGLSVCGQPLEAVMYAIMPLGNKAGLVSVVPDSMTFRELGTNADGKHQRVLQFLQGNARRLDRLASTTAAYLTAGYLLGVRDGHDDNLMVRVDGSLFRIDFGFIFNRTPGIDAPLTFVPKAVTFAMGEHRWAEVMVACEQALNALSTAAGPPGWSLLRQVHELGPLRAQARLYLHGLSLEHFQQAIEQADAWTFSRSAKNTLRGVLRYALEETEVEVPDTSGSWLGYFGASPSVRRLR